MISDRGEPIVPAAHRTPGGRRARGRVGRIRRRRVAGPPTQAKHLRRVLVAAERAAKIADRYAVRVDNPQERYRVYIADKQTWRTWHGVEPSDGGHGYTFPLEQIGTDVVLNGPRVLNGERDLRQLLGFLFGKMAILDGITAWRPENDWLESGIADYISFDARPARTTSGAQSMPPVFLRGKPPRTMVPAALGADPDSTAESLYYGQSYFAVDCLSDMYDEAKLLTFVSQVLRRSAEYDAASREAFGKPFAAVDAACVPWIQKEVARAAFGG